MRRSNDCLHKLRIACLGFLCVLVFLSSCNKQVVSNKTEADFLYYYDKGAPSPHTDNFSSNMLLQEEDSLFVKVSYYIDLDEAKVCNKWGLKIWEYYPDDQTQILNWEDLDLGEVSAESEVWFDEEKFVTNAGVDDSVEWKLKESEDFSMESKKEGIYYFWIEMRRYKNDNFIVNSGYKGAYVHHIIYSDDDPVVPSNIGIYCGDHRYGVQGEGYLDYPIAYPIVVQVVGQDGKSVNGVPVYFQLYYGPAHFADGAWQYDGISNVVQIGNSNAPAAEIIEGAVKAPVVITGEGNICVKAYILDPYKEVTFYLKGVGYDEYNEEINPDLSGFHERYPGTDIPCRGDGLWGTCPTFGTGDPVSIDLNTEAKNLRVEIDYLREGLGPSKNINLTPEDMELIYQKVAEIFTQVEIELDLEPLLDPDENGNTGIDERQPGSIIRAMDCEDIWDTTTAYGTTALKDIVLQGEYSKKDCSDILYLTRGVFGDEYFHTPDWRDLGKWERVRIHIVLLPGKYEPKENAVGMNFETEKDRSSWCASGSPSFNWADYNPTEPETKIDTVGICIFTGALPEIAPQEGMYGDKLDEVAWTWKCKDILPNGQPANDYCNILAYAIAHEIGHAIGLNDETYTEDPELKKQLMWYGRNFADPNLKLEECQEMTKIYKDNRNADYFINLRKVLGRETVIISW